MSELAYGYYWVRDTNGLTIMEYGAHGWWIMGNEQATSDEEFLRYGYEIVGRVEPPGDHVTLFDHNDRPELTHRERAMVVTSVEVVECAEEYKMLEVVLGCLTAAQSWHLHRPVPLRVYVPPRQVVWFGVRPFGHDGDALRQVPAKLKVAWRFAEEGESR